MGLDREATDIWKFGRPRDDLTTAEVIATPNPELTIEEHDRRQMMVDKSIERRMPALLKALNEPKENPQPIMVNTPFEVWSIRR